MVARQLLSEREVSEEYGLSISWLRKQRLHRLGPRYYKISRMVKYRRADIEAYLQAHMVETAPRKSQKVAL